MHLLNLLLVVPILFAADCGGRVGLDTPTTIGGSVSTGGSASTGASVSTGGNRGVGGCCTAFAASCTYGTYVGLNVYACPQGATCHEETQYCGACTAPGLCADYEGDAGAGGSTASGGATSTGGSSSVGGVTATKSTCVTGAINCPCYSSGACASGLSCNSNKKCIADCGWCLTTGGAPPAGGTTSISVDAGTGCAGSHETIQNNTGLCVAKMAASLGTSRMPET